MPSLTIYRDRQYFTPELEALIGDFEYTYSAILLCHEAIAFGAKTVCFVVNQSCFVMKQSCLGQKQFALSRSNRV